MVRFKSLLVCVLFLMMSGMSQATLTTIGTAGYDADGSGAVDSDEWYKLIWDDDNNGNSVVWLDYTNGLNFDWEDNLMKLDWKDNVNWASSLNGAGVLTIDLYDGYTVNWGDSSWRLPTTSGVWGYNQTVSEMGHLFYEELGLDAGPTSSAELNATNFDNLCATWYWSSTEYMYDPSYAWFFTTSYGYQGYNRTYRGYTIEAVRMNFGLAVRSGQVLVSPVPGSVVLFGTALLGLAGLRRKNPLIFLRFTGQKDQLPAE